MEQKKTLWIITAAGVFLAVVVFAALLLNKPNPSKVPSTASITTIEKPVPQKTEDVSDVAVQEPVDASALENLTDIDSTEISSGVEIIQEPAVEDTGSAVIVANNDGTVTIDLTQSSSSSAVTAQNENTALAIEAKKKSDKPATIYTAVPSKKSAAEVEAEKKAVVLNATKTSAKTSFSVPAVKTESVTAAPVEVTKYWVQCASYTSKKSADIARASLDENRIPAEVFTFKDSKNTLYYRVRVGPYTTKSEAEYWKNRILQIDGFKNSQSYITMN